MAKRDPIFTVLKGFVTGHRSYRRDDVHPFPDDEKRDELLRDGFLAPAPEIEPEAPPRKRSKGKVTTEAAEDAEQTGDMEAEG